MTTITLVTINGHDKAIIRSDEELSDEEFGELKTTIFETLLVEDAAVVYLGSNVEVIDERRAA